MLNRLKNQQLFFDPYVRCGQVPAHPPRAGGTHGRQGVTAYQHRDSGAETTAGARARWEHLALNDKLLEAQWATLRIKKNNSGRTQPWEQEGSLDCDIYLQEFRQVPTTNVGEKSPHAPDSRRGKGTT